MVNCAMRALVGAAALLRAASRVAALTGAGVSAESGVPTFRDAQTGLWARYRAEDLATPEAFERDPALVWDWYEMRRALVAKAQPNAAHLALAEMAGRIRGFTLATQNVDNLHQRAGSPEVIELHGNISRTKCSRDGRPCEQFTGDAGRPPRCPECGARLRPDVVWFGERLPEEAFARAERASAACEVFLSIGTSSLVYPAAGLAALAKANGAALIEVNPQPTALTATADILLQGPAGHVLPQLLRLAWPD
jgi:NAD-dependent deacetylase